MRWSAARVVYLGWAFAMTAAAWVDLGRRPISVGWTVVDLLVVAAAWLVLWARAPHRYAWLLGCCGLAWLTALFLREGWRGVPWAAGFGIALAIGLRETVRAFRRGPG